MNLLIDSGNSFIKWALSSAESFVEESSCLSAEASSLLEVWKNISSPGRVLVSNVAGQQVASKISNAAKVLWQRDAEFIVSTRECCGLTNSYNQPEQLGSDRWMAMLAAKQMVAGPVVVVDCGSAVTVDLVDEKGLFSGGVIMPGLNAAFQSLRAGTDVVNEIHVAICDVSPVAQSTQKGVAAGVLFCIAGGIERVVREQSLLLDKKIPVVVMTGGDAEKLMPYLNITVDYQPSLVLQGLKIFAEQKD